MGAHTANAKRSASTTFRSHPLPSPLADAVRARLEAAHADHPFSPLHPRQGVRRVAEILADFGVDSMVYRGGLDLRGVEVDHVWLAAAPPQRDDRAGGHSPSDPDETYVLDVAFPLFDRAFVDVLRRFVAGDGGAHELAAAAERARVADRVLGLVPAPMRYVGAPVWSSR
jgi:hypothetical protein